MDPKETAHPIAGHDLAEHKQNPSTEMIEQPTHGEEHVTIGEFIKSAVYGGVDGMVTTFTLALSSFGNKSSVATIVGFGISSLIADGLAMGIADFLATKSDDEYQIMEKEREKQEIETDFEAEKAEMRKIYRDLGEGEAESAEIVDILAQNKEGFLDVMMIEELGIVSGEESPFINSLVTFFSFAIFGLMPLLPYLVAKGSNLPNSNNLILVSGLLTLFFLFVLGFTKSLVAHSKWYWSSLEAIFIGGLAAGVGYGIGAGFGEG